MICSVILEFSTDDDTPISRIELLNLNRADNIEAAEDVGLTLAEGKTLLESVHTPSLESVYLWR
jgi:hypothetical protein